MEESRNLFEIDLPSLMEKKIKKTLIHNYSLPIDDLAVFDNWAIILRNNSLFINPIFYSSPPKYIYNIDANFIPYHLFHYPNPKLSPIVSHEFPYSFLLILSNLPSLLFCFYLYRKIRQNNPPPYIEIPLLNI